MNVPVSLGDGVDAEQAVLAAFRDHGGEPLAQAIAVDAAIDHDMRDVDALRTVFARHTLRQHAQARLGRRKVRESGLAAHAA